MKVNKNMVSGNSAMLVLKLLSEKDMYGYEMIDALAKRSNNIFEFKVGALYPMLHGMVQSGYLESYNQEVNGKLRKYYRITPNGKKYLESLNDISEIDNVIEKAAALKHQDLYKIACEIKQSKL